MAGTSNPGTLSTQRLRIARLARDRPDMGFTSLNQLLTLDALREAYALLRKDAAAGVDGRTAAEYAVDLEANLQSLLRRAHDGSYRAPPVKRVYIPKPGKAGELRPLGVPTFEDKLLQKAVATILEVVYEQDFLDCSYGYRPNRSAHDALESMWKSLMNEGGGYVVEVDIRRFFDSVDHARLRKFLAGRLKDGVLLRLIGKWLHAGVLEGGELSYPHEGVPQGGCISPLLSNVFLHYVLDEWFEQAVKPCLGGRAKLWRYADDFVVAFTDEGDTKRFMDSLATRLESFGLAIHPEKTRLIEFRRPARDAAGGGGPKGPGSFDFLGFTLHWGKSRKGAWVVRRKTARTRVRRASTAAWEWCRKRRHLPVAEQHRRLSSKLKGHYAYFGVTGNYRCLSLVYRSVLRGWRHWLGRRSWASAWSWADWTGWIARWALPPPKIVRCYLR